MNKLLYLIKKDLIISKKSMYAPAMLVAGTWVLILIGMLIGKLRGDAFNPAIILSQITVENSADIGGPFFYFMHYVSAFMISIFSMVFIGFVSGDALNLDIKLKCELFYRTQPVSVWCNTFSKYIVSIFGFMAITFAVVLVNYLLLNISLYPFYKTIYWKMGLIGISQSFLSMINATIFLGSFAFLCSAIFKNYSFMKGLGILLVIDIVFSVLEFIFSWKLVSPLSGFWEMLSQGMSFTDFPIHIGDHQTQKLSSDVVGIIPEIIRREWKAIFAVKKLLILAVSAVFYGAATLLYKLREIKS